MVTHGVDDQPPVSVCDEFGLRVEKTLGGRASQNWLVRQDKWLLVLRGHRPAAWQSPQQLSDAIEWRARARSQVRQAGWPAARPVGQPFLRCGTWWTLEEFLPGSVIPLPPHRHGELLADLHTVDVDLDLLGVQPGRLDHVAVLDDELVEAAITDCEDPDDRHWLRPRLFQARHLATDVDWTASRRVFVHGDFAVHNLLFDGSQLMGLLDFELATVDRRVIDLIHVWRCRHDDVLLSYDAIDPLTRDEWRMILIDWWALLVSLAVVQLRLGRQPDRWELDGLRRTSRVSFELEPSSEDS